MKLNRIACLPSDDTCEEFKPRYKGRKKRSSSKKAKTWKINLDAEIPEFLKPCGFFNDKIIESAWLPYESNGEISVRPSLLIKDKEGNIEVKDFLVQKEVKGTFPSQNLKTLMSPKSVKMVLNREVIDPREIDKEISEALKKHAEIGRKRQIVLKRWIEGSYFYDVFETYPILNIMGVSESGKSRILLIVLSMAYHAEGVVDPSEASIFRSKEEDKVTLCFDEAEYLNNKAMNQTLRALINASYSKGMGVPRYDEIEGKRVKRIFDLYSPFAIVGITGLEGITASRAIRVITQRANRDFPKAKQEDYKDLRDKLYVLRFQLAFKVKEIYDSLDVSHIVTARFSELFKPLFVMTRVFGTEQEFESLSEWAKMYEKIFRIENLNIAEEEQILVTLANFNPITGKGSYDCWYSLKDFTDQVNMTFRRKLWYTRVSQILARIGITERRKVKGVTQFRISKKELDIISKRLGIELPEYHKVEEKLKSINVFCRMKYLYRFMERLENG